MIIMIKPGRWAMASDHPPGTWAARKPGCTPLAPLQKAHRKWKMDVTTFTIWWLIPFMKWPARGRYPSSKGGIIITIIIINDCFIHMYIYIYPPTPAFTKAGAAPGTTGGVEPALSRPWPSHCPRSFQQQLLVCVQMVCQASKASNAPRQLPRPNLPAGLSKATLAATRPSHLFLRAGGTCFVTAMALTLSKVVPATIACLCSNGLPSFKGLKRATAAPTTKPSRRPRPSHLFLRAFKPAVCPPSNPPNPPAGLSTATLAATRRRHLFFWGRSSLPFARPQTLQTLPQAFPRQLAQLHAAGICILGSSSLPFASPPTLPTLPQAFPRQLSQLHALAIYFCTPFHGNSRSYTP